MLQRLLYLTITGSLGALFTAAPLLASDSDSSEFKMVVSAGAKACLPNATAAVKIRSAGSVEIMDVTVQGLPANTDFDFFVIQVPKAPFGVAWYQGDIVTDKNGRAPQMFVGRFNIETFAFAQGSAPAPVLFNNGVVPDASANPSFNPIPMYHLGLWFDSPDAAQKAGCPAAVTAFNGQHNAGFQVLNTSNFADDHGPLRDVTESSAKSANDEDRK